MKPHRSLHIIGALLLYLLTVGIRLYGIETASTQIDERHWSERAELVVRKLHVKSFHNLTTHLGHPGVPPGLFMASAQLVAEKINIIRGATPDSLNFIPPLSAARLASVTVSSLVVPLLYLCLTPLLGFPTALLAAALFALDPLHISLSRQAHLDAFLTLFIFGALLLYLLSLRSESLTLKLCSGVLWGCAIATKPTAAPLVVVLLLCRILYRTLSRADNARSTKLVEWSDVWIVLLGHAVFVLMYTRLWVHESDYLLRLGIRSGFADFLYFFGINLHTPLAQLLLGIVALISFVRFQQLEKRNWCTQCFLLAIVLLFFLSLVPAVFENLARYWTWALGLSAMKHRAYGINWEPPAGGYFAIVVSRLPSLIIIGIAAAIGMLLFRFFASRRTGRLSESLVTALFLGFVIWLIPLSVSSKQTIRYAMPMLPALYVVCAWGFWSVIFELTARFPRLETRFLTGALCLVPVLLQFGITAKQYPDYVLFYSALSGGLSAAMARGQSIAVAGEEGAIRVLEGEARKEGKERLTMVLGDYALMHYLQVRLFPKGKRFLRLIPFNNSSHQAEYLIVFPNFIRNLPGKLGHEPPAQKEYSYIVDGVDVLPVYKLPIPDCTTACAFPFHKSVVGTGNLTWAVHHHDRMVSLDPGLHQAGDVIRGFGVRVEAGKYRALYRLQLGVNGEEGDPEELVGNLSFSSKCERAVSRKELSASEIREFSLPCEFIKPFTPQIRFYWRGKVPTILHRAAVKSG